MAQIKSVHEFQDAWRWPEDVERFVREQVSPDREQLRVEESIRYSMPDAPSPERVEGALPPRSGSVPLSTATLGDPEAVERPLREVFRDDPQFEYQAVRRRLQARPEGTRGARPTRV